MRFCLFSGDRRHVFSADLHYEYEHAGLQLLGGPCHWCDIHRYIGDHRYHQWSVCIYFLGVCNCIHLERKNIKIGKVVSDSINVLSMVGLYQDDW